MRPSVTSLRVSAGLAICLGAGCAAQSAAPSTSTPAAASAETPAPKPVGPEKLEVRRGVAVTADGRAAPGEWDDAAELTIEVAPGWSSTVRYKHDGTNLLVAFANLGSKSGDAFVYPEVVLDPKNDGGLVWGADDWWFHASWADCWAHGSYNDYKSCNSGAKPPFEANNYTDQKVAPEWIELQIPMSTVQLAPGSSFRLGFVVTDTRREYFLWPARAQLGVPASWADARALP